MNQMKQLLLNLPQLKHFEVSAMGSLDLIDGEVWEKIADQLLTFHFSFLVKIDWIEQVLDSFRTPFWIDKKKWFVACTWERLFSVPYFLNTYTDISSRSPLYSTVSDENVFFDHVNHFILNDSSQTRQYYFRHVKILELQSLSRFENLSIVIDPSQVEHLIISSSIDHATILSLVNLIHRLRKLSINTHLINFLEQSKNMRFQQIRILEINESLIQGNFYVLEQLAQLFPMVETLRVKSIQWKSGITRLIDRFENLSNASFGLDTLPIPNQEYETESSMTRSVIDETRRLKHRTFLCRRRDYSTADQREGKYFDFWIGKQVSFYSNVLDYYYLRYSGSAFFLEQTLATATRIQLLSSK